MPKNKTLVLFSFDFCFAPFFYFLFIFKMQFPTCVLAGPCRSAVTVADANGTSSVGDLEEAGLDFLPSPGGSAAPGVDGCWP